ncbi:MAG: NADP-dependent isocitrate dehydrogenase [Verrucomicrobia bacterium]|nr:NADP-dependent isocitrate dehydrogenase [Verrucomicrobiota bacterium]
MNDSHQKVDIAVAHGDGIGPEIMEATLHVLKESGEKLRFHEIEIGEKVYLAGHPSGIAPASWDVLHSCQAFLKAPITTPQGGGFRSLNVTIRAALGLYANVRPCIAYAPCIETRHPGMDLTIIRENEEDLYVGIEYRPSHSTYRAIKVISQEGSEKIIRYAFEYAKTYGRKKVSCFTKDNILKMTDGLFHKIFNEIAVEYPDIATEHWIIDIGAAKMADTPENFDVIVTPNLYGDILSDIAAQIAGSVGLAGSANIGTHTAMFEAIHGSAPRRANQDLANPSGLLLSSVMMLVHLGKLEAAELIYNAWLKTIEEGIHTYDIFDEGRSRKKVGTKEFAKSIAERLGKKPEILKPIHYAHTGHNRPSEHKSRVSIPAAAKTIVGLDLFIESHQAIDALVGTIQKQLVGSPFILQTISNRGAIIWPTRQPHTSIGDLLRLRLVSKEKNPAISYFHLIELQQLLDLLSLDIASCEVLFHYDGKPGYSLLPGEQ